MGIERRRKHENRKNKMACRLFIGVSFALWSDRLWELKKAGRAGSGGRSSGYYRYCRRSGESAAKGT